ncbi:hypothetical protein V2J09_005976 [Rumex salicifolius]
MSDKSYVGESNNDPLSLHSNDYSGLSLVHMCGDETIFESRRLLSKPFMISLPNGKNTVVKTVGTISAIPHLRLKNSVGKLFKDLNCQVLLTPTRCLLQAPFMKGPIGIDRSHEDLYLLVRDGDKCKDLGNRVAATSRSQEDDSLWHSHLEHLPLYKLQSLPFVDSLLLDKVHLQSCDSS